LRSVFPCNPVGLNPPGTRIFSFPTPEVSPLVNQITLASLQLRSLSKGHRISSSAPVLEQACTAPFGPPPFCGPFFFILQKCKGILPCLSFFQGGPWFFRPNPPPLQFFRKGVFPLRKGLFSCLGGLVPSPVRARGHVPVLAYQLTTPRFPPFRRTLSSPPVTLSRAPAFPGKISSGLDFSLPWYRNGMDGANFP